jgi:hypothetical protein
LLGKRSLIKATLLPASLLVLLSILNNLSWRLNNYVHLRSIPKLRSGPHSSQKSSLQVINQLSCVGYHADHIQSFPSFFPFPTEMLQIY